MAKSQSSKPLKRWLTSSSDCRERRFVQIGNTLLFDKRFTSLSVGARYLYILAANEAAGSRDFQFPALKMKALGIKERTARKYIKELVDAGFIELVRSGRNTRTPNDHCFSFHWLETP